MSIEDRDYYRDRLRKRTGYAERASFRMSGHERRRAKARALAFASIKLLASVAVLFFLAKRFIF